MKVLRYLKPYWLFALLCPLAMILEVSMDLLQPTLMSDIVDNGILGDAAADENLRYVLITGLKMLVFSLIGCFGGIASAAFGTAAAQKMGNDLRKDAFAKVMHMSFQQTDKFTTGSARHKTYKRYNSDTGVCSNVAENVCKDGNAVYRRHCGNSHS